MVTTNEKQIGKQCGQMEINLKAPNQGVFLLLTLYKKQFNLIHETIKQRVIW
jgi:hypothetical protein